MPNDDTIVKLIRGFVSKYYTYGVRYLWKLDALAFHVADWDCFVPHGVYHART